MIPELTPSPRILMGPGPSAVSPRVLRAMATPLLGHLDPQFLEIMNHVSDMLRTIFRTTNELTFAVSATGSAGMEACLVNLLEPGDTAVVCINGVFGGRMRDIIERCGATPEVIEAPWGQPIDPQAVRKTLENCSPKLLAIVHAETSTGVLQPLEDIGRMVRDAGALFVVDTVTSLGGTDVRVDDWGIDAVYSGTQKCLSAPPGLSPVSFSARAVEAIDRRARKPNSWYLDVGMIKNYWGGERAYHHTAPISAVYSMYEALRIVLEEGLEARFERHRVTHDKLRLELEALGFEFIVESGYRLPMLNAVKIPDALDDSVRRRLLDEYSIEIGGGLGQFAGQVWRIGLMGHSCTINNVNLLAAALREILAGR